MKEAKKWESVFEAHPDAKEIYIGTSAQGVEQPFLKQGDAINFAGTSDRVTAIKKEQPSKSTDKSPAEPPTGEADEGDAAKKADKKNK